MYKVIEFSTGKVEVVPSRWLTDDNKVYWAKTAGAYARKGYEPKTSWSQYACTPRFNNRDFETYEEALKKCKSLMLYTDSSDGFSDGDQTKIVRGRERISTQQSDFQYYEDGHIDDIPNIDSDIPVSEKTLTPEHISDSALSNVVIEGASELDITSLLQSQCKCSGEFNPKRARGVYKTPHSYLKEVIMPEIKTLKEGVEYNRKLIEQLIINMKREWELIKFDIQNLTSNHQQQPPNTINPLKSIFDEILPLSSLDDIIVCNELLSDAEKEDYFQPLADTEGEVIFEGTVEELSSSEVNVECLASTSRAESPISTPPLRKKRKTEVDPQTTFLKSSSEALQQLCSNVQMQAKKDDISKFAECIEAEIRQIKDNGVIRELKEHIFK
ncbi:hypothetical protein FQR65_LT13418 [Abscondita terminalis]|nr:hypothetical protein FQR65_LT13418 [Abscondita terminalis]